MAGNSKYYTDGILKSYAQKFDTATVKPAAETTANTFISRMISNISTYLSIQGATRTKENPNGVPWYFVAALHMRESSMNFSTHLHNGDPLTARTVHVPAGRPAASPKNGRSYTWSESAIDALRLKGLDKWTDWSIPGMMHLFETWNGTGYIANGRTNPYLWSGTQWYTQGKYVADGQYSSTAVDKQIGTGTLLKVFLSNYTAEGKKKAYSPARSGFGGGFLSSIRFFLGI